MRRLLTAGLVSTVLLTTGPAATSSAVPAAAEGTISAAIVGGGAATPGAYPFAARVILSNNTFCGGTVIAPQWILTAAHCLSASDAGTPVATGTTVWTGTYLRSGGTSTKAAAFFVHPEYLPDIAKGNLDSSHDIALIKLASAVADAPAGLLDDASLEAVGKPATVIGWGSIVDPRSDASKSVLAPSLKEGALTIVDSTGYPGEIWARSSTASPCYGDSGGPLLVNAAGTLKVAGVVSGGPKDFGCQQPLPSGLYDYFASVRSNRTWIDSLVIVVTAPPPPPTPVAAPAKITTLAPQRFVDTRRGIGLPGRVAAGSTSAVQIAGVGAVPIGATAVLATITVVGPSASGYVTAHGCAGVPDASNLNYVADEVIPNLVLVPLSATGQLCLTSLAATDLIVDVSGFAGPTGASGYTAAGPVRVLDTRAGPGPTGKVPAGGTMQLTVVGASIGGSVVPSDATALVINVTAVDADTSGFVTAYRCGDAVPEVSNVNHLASVPSANLVVAPISNGTICLYVSARTNLLTDVAGWFSPTASGSFVPFVPTRFVDTRKGLTATRLAAGATIPVPIRTLAGLPVSAKAATVNITVVDSTASGYVTAFPCGVAVPPVSNVNVVARETRPTAAFVPISPNGNICLYAYMATDVVLDITGYLG